MVVLEEDAYITITNRVKFIDENDNENNFIAMLCIKCTLVNMT